jgi:Flp pilus assembly protein TadD
MLLSALQTRRDPSTAIALGFTLVKLGQGERALSVLSPVLTRDPLAAPALLASGMASEQLNRTADALTFYRRLLAIPAEGPQKNGLLDLQKDARARVNALDPQAAPPASSAAAPPESPNSSIVAPTRTPGKDPLSGRN